LSCFSKTTAGSFVRSKASRISEYTDKISSHHRMGNRWFSFQLHSPPVHRGASFWEGVLTEVKSIADTTHLKNISMS